MIRILLVDDHQMMRDGLRALLERQSGMQVIGDADNGRDAVRLAAELSPDVVVMDIGLPSLNGIEATRQIMASSSVIKVVALSMHADKRYVIEAFKVGVLAYLLKNCASDDLVKAIRAALHNERYLSQGIADVLVGHVLQERPHGDRSAFVDLTPREREVLQLLAEGLTSKEIGAELGIKPKTVEAQRRDIMQKLDLHSVAELTKYAIREGLISMD